MAVENAFGAHSQDGIRLYLYINSLLTNDIYDKPNVIQHW